METRRYDAINDTTIFLRSKEDDIDYRFLVDPDLPQFRIGQDRIKRVQQKMGRIPFEHKQMFSSKYNLPIVDIQTIFNHTEAIPIFEQIID